MRLFSLYLQLFATMVLAQVSLADDFYSNVNYDLAGYNSDQAAWALQFWEQLANSASSNISGTVNATRFDMNHTLYRLTPTDNSTELFLTPEELSSSIINESFVPFYRGDDNGDGWQCRNNILRWIRGTFLYSTTPGALHVYADFIGDESWKRAAAMETAWKSETYQIMNGIVGSASSLLGDIMSGTAGTQDVAKGWVELYQGLQGGSNKSPGISYFSPPGVKVQAYSIGNCFDTNTLNVMTQCVDSIVSGPVSQVSGQWYNDVGPIMFQFVWSDNKNHVEYPLVLMKVVPETQPFTPDTEGCSI